VKKHKGNGTGNPQQGAGTRRGPETGNGYTASTGRGKPSKVETQGSVLKSVLRTIGDIKTGRHSK
jgi:hypothetical protein